MTEFIVTEDHLKLAQRMYFDWDDSGYDGAPAVGLKRPYGNSDVMHDVAEILGWTDEFYENNEQLVDKAMKIHKEMAVVLQIAAFTQTWEPGTYRQIRQYDTRSWERVDV